MLDPVVAAVQWPEEAEERERLSGLGLPCLLVIAENAAPPPEWSALEDWVRRPADPLEAETRATALARRFHALHRVSVDPDGVVRANGRVAIVTPKERAVLVELAADLGMPVRRSDVEAAHSELGGAPSTLRSTVSRLRRRIGPLGLRVATLPSGSLVLTLEQAEAPSLGLSIEDAERAGLVRRAPLAVASL